MRALTLITIGAIATVVAPTNTAFGKCYLDQIKLGINEPKGAAVANITFEKASGQSHETWADDDGLATSVAIAMAAKGMSEVGHFDAVFKRSLDKLAQKSKEYADNPEAYADDVPVYQEVAKAAAALRAKIGTSALKPEHITAFFKEMGPSIKKAIDGDRIYGYKILDPKTGAVADEDEPMKEMKEFYFAQYFKDELDYNLNNLEACGNTHITLNKSAEFNRDRLERATVESGEVYDGGGDLGGEKDGLMQMLIAPTDKAD